MRSGGVGQRGQTLGVALVAALLGMVAPAGAADAPVVVAAPPPPIATAPSFISEVRGGVFAHDPSSPESGSVDINGEILFAKPWVVADPVWNMFIPRIHLGGTLNTAGKTSFAYAGLTWTFDVWKGIFVEGTFGADVNNGATGYYVPDDRSAVGCNWSFRESGSLGYRFTPNWSVMATIEHMSNAGLCNENRGVTNFGVRVGYTF
jgi:lipid A 3-O-deacylase